MQPYSVDLVKAGQATINASYTEAGREPDSLTGADWIGRTVYDYCAGMAWAVSLRKHENECRSELGLPLLPPLS